MRWLEINQAPNVYNMAYEDVLDPQTIICEVKGELQTFSQCFDIRVVDTLKARSLPVPLHRSEAQHVLSSWFCSQTLVTKVDKTRYRMEDDEINRLKKLIKATETCSDPYQIDRCESLSTRALLFSFHFSVCLLHSKCTRVEQFTRFSSNA